MLAGTNTASWVCEHKRGVSKRWENLTHIIIPCKREGWRENLRQQAASYDQKPDQTCYKHERHRKCRGKFPSQIPFYKQLTFSPHGLPRRPSVLESIRENETWTRPRGKKNVPERMCEPQKLADAAWYMLVTKYKPDTRAIRLKSRTPSINSWDFLKLDEGGRFVFEFFSRKTILAAAVESREHGPSSVHKKVK